MEIVNQQGFIEKEIDGGRTPVVSAGTSTAKADVHGNLYVEKEVNGVTGRVPVVELLGVSGGTVPPHQHPVSDIINLTEILNKKADLDNTGKVPLTQLPDGLAGGLTYKGTWDAQTNTPTLTAGNTAQNGWYYVVSGAGSQFGLTFESGDWCINHNGNWEKVNNHQSVTSVNSKTGAVVLTASDIGASPTIHTHPASDIQQDAAHRFVTDTEKNQWNAAASTTDLAAESTARQTADNTLQNQITQNTRNIAALQGAFVYRGKISLNTQDITQEALTERLTAITDRIPQLGDVLTDNDAYDWYYDGTQWQGMGQSNIILDNYATLDNLNAETTARQNADSTLHDNIDKIEGGYLNLLTDSRYLGSSWTKQSTWAISIDLPSRLSDFAIAGCNVTGQSTLRYYALTSEAIPCVAGDTFSGFFYVYLPADHNIDQLAAVEMQFRSAANTIVNNKTSQIDLTKTNQWQKIIVSEMAGTGSTNVVLKVFPRQNGKFYVTTPMIEKGEISHNYAPSEQDIINKIQIGNRNYILNSNKKYTTRYYEPIDYSADLLPKLKKGTQLALSCLINSVNTYDAGAMGYEFTVTYTDSTTETFFVSRYVNDTGETYQLYPITNIVTLKEDVTAITNFRARVMSLGTDVYVTKPQIEIANLVSDWTPATEDLPDNLKLNPSAWTFDNATYAKFQQSTTGAPSSPSAMFGFTAHTANGYGAQFGVAHNNTAWFRSKASGTVNDWCKIFDNGHIAASITPISKVDTLDSLTVNGEVPLTDCGQFTIRSNNNGMAIGVDNTLNNRTGWIQVGHADAAYGNITGNLLLNPKGGGVYINGENSNFLAWHAGNLKYEEGTWTPEVNGSTVAGTPVYDSRQGYFVRTGNQVTLHFRVDGTFSSEPSGSIYISGLPYVPGTSVKYNSTGSCWMHFTNQVVGIYMAPGVNLIRFIGQPPGVNEYAVMAQFDGVNHSKSKFTIVGTVSYIMQ